MPAREILRLIHEGARDMIKDIVETDAYVISRRERKKVWMLFVHLKRVLRLDRLRLRRPNGARGEFHFTAAAQNLRKLVKLKPNGPQFRPERPLSSHPMCAEPRRAKLARNRHQERRLPGVTIWQLSVSSQSTTQRWKTSVRRQNSLFLAPCKCCPRLQIAGRYQRRSRIARSAAR